MPWFKIDDGFWSHPKVLELSTDALALWVRAGSYCAGHLTDGEVKPSILRLMGATDAVADELVECGLWDFEGGSWWFHDWAEYQPSASATKEKRAALSVERSKAGANGAAKRWQKDGKADSNLPSVSHEGVDGKRIAPTRPDPNPSTSTDVDVITVDSFDDFWALWPRTENKAGARKAWAKAVKKIDAAELLELTSRYVLHPDRPDRQFVPHASTWLNAERWNDGAPPPRAGQRSGPVTPADRMRQTLALVPVEPQWKELA